MRSTMPFGAVIVFLLSASTLAAQAGGAGSSGGNYTGPNILSRFGRLPGANRGGPVVSAYLGLSYTYLDGLVGPVSDFNNPFLTTPGNAPTVGVKIPSEGIHSGFGGGGLSISRSDKRSSLTVGYGAGYSRAFTRVSNTYQGINQNLNINYTRQMSRRWGFYTGHGAGTQSSILGIARPTEQRNLFDQSFTAANEALDARLNFLNSGAGVFFQASRRLTFSMDGGTFIVARASQALASSRGERAGGEVSYRIGRNTSVGAMYSFGHFYFPRGFGETYTHSVMLALTRMVKRSWTMQFAVGPYQAESERLRTVAVDPFIAALTGQSSTISVFHGVSRGLSISASVGTNLRNHSFSASYRRGVDPGNGITLTALNDYAQTSWGYKGGRNWSTGVALFASRLNPLLEAAERNADFRSIGGNAGFSYRLSGAMHVTSSFALQTVNYREIHVNQVRRSVSIGLAYSPGSWSLSR